MGRYLIKVLFLNDMETKNIMIGLGALLVIVGGIFVMSMSETGEMVGAPVPSASATVPATPTTDTAPAATPVTVTTSSKEFTMNSWMTTVDGKMSAYFSLKEMVVKKGDKVKIIITNTAGTHDFVVDAYGIKVETPLNVPTVVEFTADKVGTFEYYCSKYNHRSIGQVGTLRVTE